ncbi:MAG: hypothetical protein ABIP97_06085, partial [Chthoniobacterales bacterium]
MYSVYCCCGYRISRDEIIALDAFHDNGALEATDEDKEYTMRTAIFTLTLLCMACAQLSAASVLSCFEGSTSEESCGGTGLKVCLSGNQIRQMDWTIETSR